MSRFFRSGNSTSSSESDSEPDSENDVEQNDPIEESSTSGVPELPDITNTNALDRSSISRNNSHHRDFLLHALLEERCMNEVLLSYTTDQSGCPPSRNSPQIQAEANARYQRLCAQLASYNLISTGLEGNQHSMTRQRYRDGLEILSEHPPVGPLQTTVPQPLRRLLSNTEVAGDALQQAAQQHNGTRSHRGPVPFPMRRLLTGTQPVEVLSAEQTQQPLERFHDILSSPRGDDSTFFSPLTLSQTLPNSFGGRGLPPPTAMFRSRYHDDFEQLSVLGRGGYGMVYRVRHRLDNQTYAVKKVPLSHTRLKRIQRVGLPEVEEVLRELRTLAKLDHPNIVRYFNGWIEWMDDFTPTAGNQTSAGSQMFDHDTSAAVCGEEDDRIVREKSAEDDSVLFEYSNSASVQSIIEPPEFPDSTVNGSNGIRKVRTTSTIATVSDETVESFERDDDRSATANSLPSGFNGLSTLTPTLAVHMQMSLHPMTLAEFLMPPATVPDLDAAPPLAHCFHLQPSISILQAVLDGVDHLHGHGIIHRDLKPANIFLGPITDGHSTRGSVDLLSCDDCQAENSSSPIRLEVRIGDFGLVAVADPDASENVVSEAVGTEIYRPSDGQACNPSLDIYALGMIAFELLYRFNTRMERHHTLQELKRGTFPAEFAEQWEPKRGGAMKECILSMLAQDRNTVTVAEIRDKLAAIW